MGESHSFLLEISRWHGSLAAEIHFWRVGPCPRGIGPLSYPRTSSSLDLINLNSPVGVRLGISFPCSIQRRRVTMEIPR